MITKILTIFGTRPEAIKMAPLIISLRKQGINTKIAVTAQHRDMLDQVLKIFELKPDYDLNIMKKDQTLFDVTEKIINKIKIVIEKESPDLILVHGDTTTAFISSLAAYYLKVPTGHVEAGLRTYNKYEPFPEEINRQLVDRICDFCFCPTKDNQKNLEKENIKAKTFVTGNTVIDAAKYIASKNLSFNNNQLQKYDFGKRTILFTCHRRESFGKTIESIFHAIDEVAAKYPDVNIIYPVHPNPQVFIPAKTILSHRSNIFLTDPIDYSDMINLINRSYFVVTDSGGLQEEAPALNKPVLVLRNQTERQEGLKSGSLKLIGTNPKNIVKEISKLIENKNLYHKMATSKNPFGNGTSSQKITNIISKI